MGSVLAGLGLMYFLDPDRGRRRRAITRDKLGRGLDAARDAAATTGRDLRNRARGVVAEAKTAIRGEGPVTDDVLAERVRSTLGRVVSHPGSIDVAAAGGVVTLSGPVLAREVDHLLSCVSKVRGVQDVENLLVIHAAAGDVPGLQGPGRKPERRFELLQVNWSPTARLLAGAAGGGLTALGVRKGGWKGTTLGVVGIGLLARAITNLGLERLLGLGSGPRGIDVRRTIRIDAPVDRVFDHWAEISNFPLFLSHVIEVRDRGRGVSHWKAAGPAGIPVEWDAVVTALVPNQLIAWKTLPRQAVRHSGVVQFDEDPAGGTRVDVHLTYEPAAGALGHALAALFGNDPKQALENDLVRLKALLESGKTTVPGEEGEEVVAVEIPQAAPEPSELPESSLGAAPAEGEIGEIGEIGETTESAEDRGPRRRSRAKPSRPDRPARPPRAET
jgi:uncharacterized membrane protein